ncbi:MAG: paaD [Aeromicrobium sp.]|nr:paaD [Aeromicrobium sp.]
MPEHVNAQEVAEVSTKAMWAGDRASRLLGMEIVEVGPGGATVSMVIGPDMANGWDVGHGGFIASLADTAFALACNSHGEVTVAAGFDITFLESALAGDTLLATASQRTSRGRTGIYDVTVTRTADSTTIAEFRGRSHSLGRPIT